MRGAGDGSGELPEGAPSIGRATTVHVVDDDPPTLASLSALLRAAGHRVVEHAGAVSVLGISAELEGSCLVLDVRMPDIDGLELLSRIRATGSRVPVVVVTGQADVATAVRAMKLGAWDFLEKPFPPSAMLQAVRSAIRHGTLETGELAFGRAFLERVELLTRREREVFDLVLLGRTNRDIAQVLDISHRTVEIYRAKVMTKTGS